MGCSTSRFPYLWKHTDVVIVAAPVVPDTPKFIPSHPSPSPPLTISKRDQDTMSVSSQNSSRSDMTNMTSVRSFNGVVIYPSLGRKSHQSEDMCSNVPCISEFVANMEDLHTLSPSNSFAILDLRQHPLAPITGPKDATPEFSSSHMSGCLSDLGRCSDVPSVSASGVFEIGIATPYGLSDEDPLAEVTLTVDPLPLEQS